MSVVEQEPSPTVAAEQKQIPTISKSASPTNPTGQTPVQEPQTLIRTYPSEEPQATPIQEILRKQLSPEAVEDIALPKRFDSVQLQPSTFTQNMQGCSPIEVAALNSARSLHRATQSLTTSQQTSLGAGGQRKNAPGERPHRTSDPLENTLIKLMDGISDISQCGGHDYATRDANDIDTPSIRSPISIDAPKKEKSPFKIAAPSNQQMASGVSGGNPNPAAQQPRNSFVTGKQQTKGSKMSINIPRLSISKALASGKVAPTSTEVRSSAGKKFQIPPISPDMTMVHESHTSGAQNNQSQATLLKELTVGATGGQHEAQEQRRTRVMSFSEASDSESNQSMLSYSRRQKAAHLSLPKGSDYNYSTNSSSDADCQKKYNRRHRRQRRLSDVSGSANDCSKSQIRFSAPLQNSKFRNQKAGSSSPLDVQRRDFVHPFAHQPTPFEKLQEICTNFSETSLFITYEVLVWILDKLWGLLINLILLPIAVLGLALDYLRQQARRCPRRQRNQIIRVPNKKRNLQIVLDLDLTLVYCTLHKPTDMFGLNGTEIPDYTIVNNKAYGEEIYVYKRPHLREFLSKASQLGQISLFTHHKQCYADPIIDKLDPEKKIFKQRFYSQNCVSNGDGEILKDMRVLDNQPTEEPNQGGHHQPLPNISFSQRLNRAIGVPVFGISAFMGTGANVRNQGDIQLSHNLLQRLVIVDDGILTYNAYKNNTIRITQWKASVRNDRALLDCLEIIQQLGNNRDVNVSKDLQYIIDTTSMYKAGPHSVMN